MAWFRDDEADFRETIEEAGRAHTEGRTVFVARLRMKYERRDAGPVPLAAMLIEGVEQAGWELSYMSESLVGDVIAQMTCIFRRR